MNLEPRDELMRLNDEESTVMVEFGVDDDDDEGFCPASFLKVLRRRISSESVKTRPFWEVGEETGDVATCLRFLGVDVMVGLDLEKTKL